MYFTLSNICVRSLMNGKRAVLVSSKTTEILGREIFYLMRSFVCPVRSFGWLFDPVGRLLSLVPMAGIWIKEVYCQEWWLFETVSVIDWQRLRKFFLLEFFLEIITKTCITSINLSSLFINRSVKRGLRKEPIGNPEVCTKSTAGIDILIAEKNKLFLWSKAKSESWKSRSREILIQCLGSREGNKLFKLKQSRNNSLGMSKLLRLSPHGKLTQ